MPNFAWKGINQAGAKQHGVCQSSSKEMATGQLLGQGIAVLDITEKKNTLMNKLLSFAPLQQLSQQQLYLFFDQLTLMLDHGTELAQALTIIQKTTKTKILQEFISNIIQQLHEGKSFAQALADQPDPLPSYICPLVAAGESSGSLKNTTGNIKTLLGNSLHIRGLVQKAAFTPLITLIFAFFIVLSVILFLIPHFQSLYQSFGKQPPASTLLLFALSTFLNAHWLGVCVGTVMLILFGIPLLRFIKQIPKLSSMWPTVLMHVPLLSTVIINKELGLSTSIIATYLNSGLQLSQALEQCIQTTQNTSFKMFLSGLVQEINQGNSFAEALQTTPSYFSNIQLVCLVQTGEQSGNLALTFTKLSQYFNHNLDEMVNTLAAILSPLLMCAVGLIIAALMAMLYIPLFNLGNLFNM